MGSARLTAARADPLADPRIRPLFYLLDRRRRYFRSLYVLPAVKVKARESGKRASYDATAWSDPVADRPSFGAMLAEIAADGVRTILIESPDRFARDLAVQLAGHDHLKRLGVALVPTSAPDHFTEDTPTAILVCQVLGAIAQFDKDTTVSALAAAVRVSERAASRCRTSRSAVTKRQAAVPPPLGVTYLLADGTARSCIGNAAAVGSRRHWH